MDGMTKISKYAFQRFEVDLQYLQKELNDLKLVAAENPGEFNQELDYLSTKIIEMENQKSRWEIVNVVKGLKTLQVGYTVHLNIKGQLAIRVLDGYSYHKQVCSVTSSIGKNIINKPIGHTFGDGYKIVDFFVAQENEILVS